MRYFKLIMVLLGLLLTLSIESYSQSSWTLEQVRTVELDLRERLGLQGIVRLHKVADYHGRYYCIYSYNSMLAGSGGMMVVIDKSTLAMEVLPVPERFGHYLSELFVRHDTLFYYDYVPNTTTDYFFDTLTHGWTPCTKVDYIVAEDDDYRVYALDHGEWGAATWFVNRATGKEKVVWALGEVHRVGDTYYIASSMSVCGLSLSRLAAAKSSPVSYAKADADYVALKKCSKVGIVPDIFYIDPRYNGFLEYIGVHRDTLLVGSLVDEHGLLLVANVNGTMQLMRLGDSTHLVTEYETGVALPEERINLLLPKRSGVDASRLLFPIQYDELNVSLLDFHDGRISRLAIHHVVDTMPMCSSDRLEELITYLEAGWGCLEASQVMAYELAHEGTFLKEDMLRNGYLEELGLTDNNCRALQFKKHVSGLYNIRTMYCIRMEDHSVAAVFFDFRFPDPYLSRFEKSWNKIGYREERQKWYAQQATVMTARLDTLCGPHSSPVENELHWKHGQMTLVYYPTSGRLMIY